MQQDNTNKKPLCIMLWCAFIGGDERGDFTGEQLRYPCKLRRYICARCGMHRGEHNTNAGGIKEEQLPPRKRSAFRLGQFKLQGMADSISEEKKRETLEEGEIWNGDAVTKGKRGPRRKRADAHTTEL